MIRVRAPSRLHFGLLSLGGGPGGRPAPWPDRHGQPALPARRFGGVGLMVEAPGVRLAAAPAPAWSAEGPLAGRALAFAERFAQTFPPDVARPCRLVVEQAAPEHGGLGTGTQLGLAVARALAAAWGLGDLDAVELGRRVGRGLRSGLGVHGFARGGFLVDAGRGAAEAVAPLAARLPFPEDWRVVVVIPPGAAGLHGADELRAFEQLAAGPADLARTEALCRLVLLGLLPALAERDLAAFGEALYDFNARVGEAFAAAQGGPYAGPAVAEAVAFLRRQGARGVGQSSWGPAVFAVVGDADQAQDLAGRVCRSHLGLSGDAVLVTPACNRGATAEGP
jgi:beta-RFAP synthase